MRSILLAAAISLTACGAPAVRGIGYCAPPVSVPSYASDPPPAAGAPRDERVASLLGVHAEWSSGATDDTTRLRVLARLEEARLAIAGVRAELDCDGESAEQVADTLARTQSSATQGLTIASVAAAAVTSIVGVFLSTNQSPRWTQNGFAIGGGVITAGLGVGSLVVRPRTKFDHPRNMLADVWNGSARSTTYPPLVWGYLTDPQFSNEQRQSIRTQIVERWKHFQRVQDDPQNVALLFGAGGAYDIDALRMRAQMLDEVKAEVDLMNQDLAVFATRLSARTTTASPP